MKNIDKILAEFDKKFPAYLNGERGDYTQAPLPAIKSFLSTSIAQALAEEKARVMKLVIKDIQSAPHCNSSHSDLLSSLDKPLP